MSDVGNNATKKPGGITGKGFRPGQSGNADGVPRWVSEARAAIRGRLWDLAQRHLTRVLSGERPADSSEAEDALYLDVSIEDRNAAAKLVMEYSIPKPKQSVGLTHSGPEGQPLSIVIDMGAK